MVNGVRLVPVPAASLAVWLPMLTICAPVVPPLPTSVANTVVSIFRLNFPLSVVGLVTLVTVSFGLRVLVMVQLLLSPAASLTLPVVGSQSPLITLVRSEERRVGKEC